MGNDVFADGREVSCKAADGKSIAAFPDVCFTPPENPATPPGVPLPYPNTGFATDTTDGTTTVKITGKEVMLKNKSYFKKSTGDEAGCAAKKGTITSVNRGKAYFIAWSMDVKFEGENVVRHLDMTTHNHAPAPPNSLTTVYQDMLATLPAECSKMVADFNTNCRSAKVNKNDETVTGCTNACKDAQKCILAPKDKDKLYCCGTDTERHERTGHHLIEVDCFSPVGLRGHPSKAWRGIEKAAPRAFAHLTAEGTHGILHAVQSKLEAAHNSVGKVLEEWIDPENKDRLNVSRWRYKHARDAGARAHKIAFPHCDEECTKKQLDAYHKGQAGIKENSPLRTDPVATRHGGGELTPWQKGQITRAVNAILGIG